VRIDEKVNKERHPLGASLRAPDADKSSSSICRKNGTEIPFFSHTDEGFCSAEERGTLMRKGGGVALVNENLG